MESILGPPALPHGEPMALPDLLQDLAVIALVAAATMAAMRGLRQPAVLGYILAGIIVGPFPPPFTFVR